MGMLPPTLHVMFIEVKSGTGPLSLIRRVNRDGVGVRKSSWPTCQAGYRTPATSIYLRYPWADTVLERVQRRTPAAAKIFMDGILNNEVRELLDLESIDKNTLAVRQLII